MARMETDCISKKLGYFVQVYHYCLGKLAKTLIIVHFLFKSLLVIFLLVFYKYFMFDKGA